MFQVPLCPQAVKVFPEMLDSHALSKQYSLDF